jgi:Mrp family chromosome partitioning ATPase
MKRKIRGATVNIKDSHLDVVLSGATPDNPAEMLGSERFIELVSEMKKGYDYVIVDTPPVLAVADATIVSRVTENVVLLVHAGSTSKRNFEAAREAIASIGVELLGALLNKVPKFKTGEHYGYTYADPNMGYYRYTYAYTPDQKIIDPEKSKGLRQKIMNQRRSRAALEIRPPTQNFIPVETKSEFELLLEKIKREN